MKMKKYLTMVLAIAISGVFVGCHEDELSGSLIEQKKIAFEDAFIQAFGQPDPNHNWGFRMPEGEDRAFTRTVHKKDPEQGFDYEHEPPAVTDAEAAYVYEWFQKEENKGLSEQGQDWDTFYLQHVYGTMDKQKRGLWNKYDENVYKRGEGDGWLGDQEFTDKGGMDYLILTDNNGYTEHVNDFNAEMGGPSGIVYMTNSSALYFGYHSTWDNSERQLFKLAQITVPGRCFGEGEADRVGWYVGLSLYGEKWNNGKEGDPYKNQRIGVQRYDWGDDWILKVVPGESTPRPTAPQVKQVSETPGGYYVIVRNVVESGRVMCEDLAGASGRLDDLDYNDIVFDAIIVNEYKLPTLADGTPTGGAAFDDKYYATVRLMAAGGTIPVEMVIPEESGDQNFDVHSLLGAGDNVMINTLHEADRSKVNGAAVKEDAEPVTLKNKKDDTDKFYGVRYIKDITLNVLYNRVSTTLENSGAAPLKFLVPLGTKWAKERTIISSAYPDFTSWVKDQYYNDNCFANNVPDNLYDDFVGLSETGIVNSDPIYIEGSESYSKTPVAATSAMAYPSASEKTIYNFAAENADPGYLCPAVGSETEEYLNVTLSDDDKASIAVDQVIRIYGVYIAGWYVTTNISGTESFASFSANGNYIDIPVTSGNIDQIKSNIAIRGKHFTVTYVTIVGAGEDTHENPNTQIEGTVLWGEGPLDFGNHHILALGKDVLKNANATGGDKIRFYLESSAKKYGQSENQWEMSIFTGYEQGWTLNTPSANGNDTSIANGYFEITLTQDDADVLTMKKNMGWTVNTSLKIQGYRFILHYITLIKQ